jgi:ligand-binding SRPBCC domain-containing protein
MHQLERKMVISASAEQVWDFLATPLNLDRLTPPELKFRILSSVPETMYDGLLIRYQIGIPLFGRWQWLTEIKHIAAGHRFVDEQRRGPYRFWYHQHEIVPLDDGHTRMIDRVTYQLPFGLLGELVHLFYVRATLERIFAYRQEKLREIFG